MELQEVALVIERTLERRARLGVVRLAELELATLELLESRPPDGQQALCEVVAGVRRDVRLVVALQQRDLADRGALVSFAVADAARHDAEGAERELAAGVHRQVALGIHAELAGEQLGLLAEVERARCALEGLPRCAEHTLSAEGQLVARLEAGVGRHLVGLAFLLRLLVRARQLRFDALGGVPEAQLGALDRQFLELADVDAAAGLQAGLADVEHLLERRRVKVRGHDGDGGADGDRQGRGEDDDRMLLHEVADRRQHLLALLRLEEVGGDLAQPVGAGLADGLARLGVHLEGAGVDSRDVGRLFDGGRESLTGVAGEVGGREVVDDQLEQPAADLLAEQ